jgi:Uma2 family endonuclease
LGIVRGAPFQMKLPGSGREPDLLFVAARHVDRLCHTRLDGPADLVVEVLSPESVSRDRGEKFYEYARGGVPEYWLIDPDAQWVEFYRLVEGRYRLAFEGATGQYYAQAIPGFWVQVAWFWQPPRVLDALRELQVIA